MPKVDPFAKFGGKEIKRPVYDEYGIKIMYKDSVDPCEKYRIHEIPPLPKGYEHYKTVEKNKVPPLPKRVVIIKSKRIPTPE